MNDIAKMRKEFDEQIRLAELENKYNERLEPHGISLKIVSAKSLTQKGKIHATLRKVGDAWLCPFDGHDAQQALRLLPMTENLSVYNGRSYEMLPYHMTTSRTPSQPRTILSVDYIHDDLNVGFELHIDERDPEMMQYFQRTQRELDSREIGLYYGAVSPRTKSNVQMLPFLTFNCGRVVRFQGGHHTQLSEGHLTSIAASIEGNDFAFERTSE